MKDMNKWNSILKNKNIDVDNSVWSEAFKYIFQNDDYFYKLMALIVSNTQEITKY